MNRPWAMEPQAAEHWSKIAHKLFATGELPHTGLPNFDNRSLYQGYADTGYIYRVNEQANIASDGSIQVIKLIGPITKYDLCNSPGSQSIARMLTAAYADNSIKAVLLYTDCPGGQAEGIEEVGNTIKNRNKPVIVYKTYGTEVDFYANIGVKGFSTTLKRFPIVNEDLYNKINIAVSSFEIILED